MPGTSCWGSNRATSPWRLKRDFETLQGLARRVALKMRDSMIERVVILVADTRHNRRLLELHREDLRASFPLDTRAVMTALRNGLAPEASGIVVL